MISLNSYITEKFQVSKDYKRQYAYQPKTKGELIDCIIEKTNKEGFGTKDKPLDLNDIDTSKITDMSYLFYGSDNYRLCNLSKNGNFDISDWDVSNVTNMEAMFYNSNFDGDISEWNVSNVKNMEYMFTFSQFTGKNGDISNWDISNVKNMYAIFYNCQLEDNPPKWYNK